MGKKRNQSKHMPTTMNFWANITRNKNSIQQIPPTNFTLDQDIASTPGTSSFQAPDHQSESLIDLTDDTSPDIPSKQGVQKGQTNESKQPQSDMQTHKKTPIVIGLNTANQNKQSNNSQVVNNPNEGGKTICTRITIGQPQPQKTKQTKQPAQLQPRKQLPAQTKPPELQPRPLQPAQLQPRQLQAAPLQPTQQQPIQMQPRLLHPVQMQPTQQQPVQIEPPLMQPDQLQPTQFQQPQLQPAQFQPPQMQPDQLQPTQFQQPQLQPAQFQPAQLQPAQLQPAQMQPAQMQPAHLQQPLLQPPYQQPAELQPAQIQQRQLTTVQLQPQPQRKPPQPQYTLPGMMFSFPKGIPKSFLYNPTPKMPLSYTSMIAMPESIAQNWDSVNSPYAPAPNPYEAQEETNNAYNYQDPVLDQQVYSPSDVYADNVMGTDEPSDNSQSPDAFQNMQQGEKRLSAFRRLGPMTQPKKPKMTINLLCNKDQSFREVVDEDDGEKYVPVHMRNDIITSKDETVVKYRELWPWKHGVPIKKTVMPRNSKTVMILEQEQMDEVYERSYLFIKVSVQGYPSDWTKEMLLDTIMDAVNEISFVPCFIEFAPEECKFLVIRARVALNILHKLGLVIRKGDIELTLVISQTELTTHTLDFLPKGILKKRLQMSLVDDTSMDLSRFTLKEDISHFIYFPLNRSINQTDLLQVQILSQWENLTELNLSHNRITSIEGFRLSSITPKLKKLDLSHNWLEKATELLQCKTLSLQSLKLEGNPLCHDYTDPQHYIKVLRLMFPTLKEIDGIAITLKDDMPVFQKNYCPDESEGIVNKFLEVYFPLLEANDENRALIEEMYDEKAVMTVTYRYKLRHNPVYRQFRSLFNHSRVMRDGDAEQTEGAENIARQIGQWPPLKHDPFTFTVDVLHHDEYSTIFKVTGLLKLTAETLAEDEHLLAFSRTVVLQTNDGVDYKITNEMIYWEQPTEDYARDAFNITTVKPKRLTLKMESTPDDDLKQRLVEVFMKLTELDKTTSEKCLEQKGWNLKHALDYFIKLLKLDEIETLMKDII